jgi:insertion element IS1 protein InsB
VTKWGLLLENKKQKQWVWLAIDKDTGEIVGVFIGDRSQTGAKKLWDSLPSVYRQCAVCYTDFWKAYSCDISRSTPQGRR